MHFTIRFSGGKSSDFGDHDFQRIMTDSLARFARRLHQVYLYIEDVNGPRGGVDKQCRCVLHLKRMPPVVIQDQDQRLDTLIHRVANRAAYVLSQKTDRRNKRALQNRDRRPILPDLLAVEPSDGVSQPLQLGQLPQERLS